MFATAPTGSTRPAHEETVRLRPLDLPVIGTVANTVRQRYAEGSAAVGYVRRYIGDAGGLGVAFFVVAYALASVAFAVFPTWAGPMATVALLPRGEEMMFDLHIATLAITLVGHVIFGLVLGFAFLKAPRGRDRSEWPWPTLIESAHAKRAIRFAKKRTHSP